MAGAPGGFVARIVPADDAIWFAASDGAYRLDRGRIGSGLRAADWTRYTSADRLPADQTTCVVPVPGGAWIGTLRGLAKLDVTNRSVTTTLAGLRVLDLALAGDTLWIATQSGLFVSVADGVPAPATGLENAQSLRTGPVVALANVGGVITALTPAAVHRLEQGQWSAPIRDPATRALGPLFRLHVAADGGVWIAGEAGVAAVEAGKPVRTWLVPDDIPAGPVRGIVLDGDDLWVATPAGALRLDHTR
jgi:ligand-binding sensor domain-containing protein